MPKGFIVHPTYRVRDGIPVVQLFGRLNSGEPFLVEEHRYRPYFWIRRGEERWLPQSAAYQLEESKLRDLSGSAMQRVRVSIPAQVPPLRDSIIRAGGRPCEADIRFPYRFLTDQCIRATCEIHTRGSQNADGLVRFHNPDLRPALAQVRLSTLSLDLETTAQMDQILSAAFIVEDTQGKRREEVHLVSDRPVRGAVVHPEEPALLFAVMKRIRQLDPDILTGWNVIDFDLRVWIARCEAHRIPCHLGRIPEAPRLIDERGRNRTRCEIPGRMVLDGLQLVREAIRLPDYRLDSVAQELLGRGKKRDPNVVDAAAEIYRMWREDPHALVAYNLEDARLVLDILQREGLLALTQERSQLTGMQLDRVSASVANFDLVYLPALRSRGYVAPSPIRQRENSRIQGGAVLEPRPGLHQHVAVMDFKSLYPSLIQSFQLDPLAHALSNADEDAIQAPNGACFAREGALLPTIIDEWMRRRDEAKARGQKHVSQAVKILMNSMFGVIGTPSCRFFSPAIANAITSFGQQILHWTQQAFEELRTPVLYGDTDSVFIQLPSAANRAELEACAESLRKRAQLALTSRIRQEYRLEPRLELQLEKIYDAFFLPRVRGGHQGSKKRYAGWESGTLSIVGLESVRSDWPELARHLQEGMLRLLFTQRDPAHFIAKVVEELRKGAFDQNLVYTKRLRKNSLDEYASNAPHVQAARKLGNHPPHTIRYVMTKSGPEPVLHGAAIPSSIDYTHYIDKVLRPVADSILLEFGQSFDDVLGNPRQLSMF